MSRLYLITGFLGAGKTTFLRRFLHLFPGENLRLIINEFGAQGVDGELLSDLRATLREISGGSVFCACRLDQFEKELMACREDETILVEASGLSDPTGVRQLLGQTERFPQIEYMGGICLVDAVRFPKVYATARSCVRQLAASDMVLLNKVDRATPEQLEATRSLILGQRPEIPIIETSYGEIPDNFLQILAASQTGDRGDLPLISDLTTKSLSVRLSPEIAAYDLEMFIRMFAEETYRVKGFVMTKDCGLVLADCVGNVVSLEHTELSPPEEKIGVLTILSGGKAPIRSALKRAIQWYKPYII